MKKIIVSKTLAYDPTFGGQYSRFDGYSLITLQQKSPKISSMTLLKTPKVKVNAIFCSPLRRGVQTAEIFGQVLNQGNIIEVEELKEVLFDLKSLVSENEFKEKGSTLVRQRFIDAFIQDQLLESRTRLKERAESLLQRIANLDGRTYLLISHSFFMKLLQIYLKNNNLFDQPELLQKYFDVTKKTFDHGDGFSFYVK